MRIHRGTRQRERRVSPEAYLAMPESNSRCALIDGVLIEEPAGTDFHQSISLKLAIRVGSWAERSGLGIVRAAPSDVWLDDRTVVQPDVFFVSHERVRYFKDWLRCTPDWLAEILSPSTIRLDRERKRRLYAQQGVREMWLVDPVGRRVEVYRFAASAEMPIVIAGQKDVLTSPVLPGLSVRVAEIFRA